MPLRDHWWCILVAKYGAFLFTEIGAFVITDYSKLVANCFCFLYLGLVTLFLVLKQLYITSKVK